MPLFQGLPLELLEQIIILCSPQGTARLSQCCKQLNVIVQQDIHIWRALYLENWDDPRSSDSDEYDWRGELQKNVLAWNIVRALRAIEPPFEMSGSLLEMIHDAYRQCASILLHSRGPNAVSPHDLSGSRNLTWLKQVVGAHAVYLWPWLVPDNILDTYPYPIELNGGAGVAPKPEGIGDQRDDTQDGDDLPEDLLYLTKLPERWRLMRLAGYLPPSMSYWFHEPTTPLSYARRTRNAARCFVYDMRKYKLETRWGPWTRVPYNENNNDHGAEGAKRQVNWEHVFRLLVVTLANMEESIARGHFADLAAPSGYENTAPYSAPGWNNRPPGDWAGVRGTWKRVICFMGYRDLVIFNFPGLFAFRDTLDDDVFRDPDFEEEFRVLHMTLTIESIDDPSTPGLIDSTRPTIRFRGISSGGTQDESAVRGTVSITQSGDIRWHLVSTFDRENRWQSEGVQIGGPGSAFGAIGCWSPYKHGSPRDPAGPFWMWKVGGASDTETTQTAIY